jgi:hypothetical protein
MIRFNIAPKALNIDFARQDRFVIMAGNNLIFMQPIQRHLCDAETNHLRTITIL